MYSPRNNTTTSLIQWKLFPYGSREIDVWVASWINGLQLVCVESDSLVNTGSSLYPSSLSRAGREKPGSDHLSVDQAGLARRVSEVGQGGLRQRGDD